MKKLLGICLVLCVFMLAGCSQNSSIKEDTSSTAGIDKVVKTAIDESTPTTPTVCEVCGIGEMPLCDDDTAWHRTGEQRSCKEHVYGTDIKLSRIAGNANTCGGSEDNIKAEILEIAWDCRGFCGDELDSIS